MAEDARPLLDFLGGDPDTSPERWRWASPSTWVDTVPYAVYLATGERDQWTPYRAVQPYAEELLSRSTEHRFVPLPDADHCADLVWGGLPAQTVRHTMLEFLRRNLGRPGTAPERYPGA
ncbi:hypothetical protein JOF53_008402 [Crossiella equi]|uniref:Uncharacterized protein n=1 Tax=Crossiella equi TaxID=130796 RepID=A0ABS5AUZ1_9PSEU|nr:hypothetical protein [Crossiella equi]MBP2479530.1 hypothetical protein [Crossiella equi]